MRSRSRSAAGPTPERKRIAGVPYEPPGEDHLARRDFTAACGDHAYCSTLIEEDAIDEHIPRDLQIGPVADLFGEIDEAGVLTHAFDHVDRVAAHAARIRTVEVGAMPEPLGHAGVDEPAQRGGQIVVLQLTDRKRSRAPVVGVAPVRHVLHLLVGGVNILDRPGVKAMTLPIDDVARPCAHRDRGVVGRAAA